tara:strand:+ start:83 stop:427 length:345 start_codon:yes stop_codon:yes gene_type:complete
MTDSTITEELYRRLELRRKALGINQEKMTESLGITPKTYRSIKQGTCSLLVFLMALRQLDLLGNFELLIPSEAKRPTDVLREEEKQRKRKASQFDDNTMNKNTTDILGSRKKLK